MEIWYALFGESNIGLIISVLGIIVGICTALWSKKEGRSAVGWMILAVVFTLIAIAGVFVDGQSTDFTKVPNLINLSKRDAINSLYAADLEVDFPAGTPEDAIVIGQEPAKGKSVKKGTTVDLIFDEGAGGCTGPVRIGDTVSFGTYVQNEAAPRAIQWEVLDLQNGKVLLLSKYALEAMSFNSSDGVISWKNCSLRDWLNDDFLYTAFSSQERNAIVETETERDCQDRVFLLSYTEVSDYLSSERSRICGPTEHVKNQSTDTLDTTRAINNGKDLAVWWWLRSLAEGGTQAYYVNFEGRMYTNLVANGYLSVRPALWIDCEAADLAADN